MLIPPSLTTDLSHHMPVEPWAPYDYLIGSAAPNLSSATCLYFDGIESDSSYAKVIHLAEVWFHRFNHKPKAVVLGGDKSLLPSRPSMRALKDAIENYKLRAAIETVELFPETRTTLDRTWRPSIYLASSFRRPASVFLSVNAVLSEKETKERLLEGVKLLGSCAGYGFLFPAWFSPLAYYWGISVEPSYRAIGEWDRSRSTRLSNWRDNASIGIESGGHRAFYQVCEGYVRDAYPLMVFNEQHLVRENESGTLMDMLAMLGDVSSQEGMAFCRFHNEDLVRAQQLMDRSNITLSGRRFSVGQQMEKGGGG